MAEAAFPESALEFGIFDWIEHAPAPPGEVFEHKLRLAEAADRAGFYGWHLAEHQGTPLSIDCSPALILAAATQRTQRLRIGPLTFCLPWHDPYRLYNEICMLDHLSAGRLELGVGRGVSPIESAHFGIASIEESRERYRESLDIFFTACRSRVLDYAGKYHRYRDLELYNYPYQRPYPPLWFPSSDRASVDFTARHGYNTVLNTTTAEAGRLYARYREIWLRHRDDPGRHNAHVRAPKLAKIQHLVIADTDAEATAAGLAAYAAWKDHMTHLTRKHGRPDLLANLDPVAQDSVARLVAGAPRTVLEQLAAVVRDAGINYLMLVLSFGSLPAARAMRSLELFAEEVMPALRAGNKTAG